MSKPIIPDQDQDNIDASEVVGTLGLGDTAPSQEGNSPLTIYRLTPSAEANDPHWDLAPSHGVLIVRALSPADARIVAADAEIDYLDISAKPGDGTTTTFASAFRNEKMYHVSEEPDGRYQVTGGRGVIDRLDVDLRDTTPSV